MQQDQIELAYALAALYFPMFVAACDAITKENLVFSADVKPEFLWKKIMNNLWSLSLTTAKFKKGILVLSIKLSFTP